MISSDCAAIRVGGVEIVLIAKKVIYIDSSGPLPCDHRKIPSRKIERPIWPLDPDAQPRGLIF